MALVGDALYIANTDAVVKVPYREGDTSIAQAPVKVADLPAGHAQSSLDQEPHREPRRQQALRHRRLEQQRRRERHGSRSRTAPRSSRSTPRSGATRLFASGLRNPNGLAWHPRIGRAVDRGQRARRARQQPRSRLPHVGARGRVLRMAVQLFRRQCRHAGLAAAARSRRARDGARLRAGLARRAARPRVLRRAASAAAVPRRRVRRRARLVEPHAEVRLQGRVRRRSPTAGPPGCRKT